MSKSDVFLSKVEEIVGSGALECEPSSLHRYSVSGKQPAASATPADADMLAEILSAASMNGGRLVPRGSGTKLNTGRQPDSPFLTLSTRGLDRIIDHDAANFTVTAQAGMLVTSLRRVVKEEGQLLPLDPPYLNATLGGVFCANSGGPLRMLYGGLRDLILGARVVLPGGRRGNFGGKVVKNVAGYDISKFLIGSMGTLGVLEEVTLKLYPQPETEVTSIALFADPNAAFAAAAEVRSSQLSPARMMLLDHDMAALSEVDDIIPDGEELYALLISFHGFREAADRKIKDTRGLCSKHGAVHQEALEDDRELWEKMPAVNQSASESSFVILKLGVPCADLAAAYSQICLPFQTRHGASVMIDAGWGIVHMFLPQKEGEGNYPFTQGEFEALSSVVKGCGGYMSVENAHRSVGYLSSVCANRMTAYKVMELIRRKYDPDGVLCPERVPWLLKT